MQIQMEKKETSCINTQSYFLSLVFRVRFGIVTFSVMIIKYG